MEQILAAVTQAVIPAVQSGIGGLNIDKQVKEAGKAVQEEAEKKLDSLKGLFGN
jgi:hypothetical protein